MDRARTNLQATVVGVAFLLVVGGIAWFGTGGSQPTPPESPATPVAESVGLSTVHVSGAVVNPGVVRIPGDSRVADAVAAAGGATTTADLSSLNLAAVVRDGDHVTVPHMGEAAPGPTDGGVDMNSATAAELETLPGVGPVLAARIVEFRTEHGAFTEVEDLLDVPGIGEAKLAAIRDSIGAP